MKKIIFIGTLLVSGCFSENTDSTRILLEQGYSEIHLTGLNPFACSEDDAFRTGFKAKSPNGSLVKGTVCCGLFFKDCTIRLE